MRIAIRSLAAFFVLGFVALMVYTTITPAREAIQDFAVCRGADSIDRIDSRSTQRRSGPGGYQDHGATTTDLTCHFGDRVRVVRNDEAFLRGGGLFLGGVALLAVGYGVGRTALTSWARDRTVRPVV